MGVKVTQIMNEPLRVKVTLVLSESEFWKVTYDANESDYVKVTETLNEKALSVKTQGFFSSNHIGKRGQINR